MSYTEKITENIHLISCSRHINVIDLKPLRTCKDCGLVAKTINDLDLFVKAKKLPHGRSTWCKKCAATYARDHYPPKNMKQAIDNLVHPCYCFVCGKEITKFKGLKGDCITLHSLDGNHNNWSQDNKVPTHRNCHQYFHLAHRKPEIYQKISQALTGIKRSEETKRKMSNSKTPEIRQKLRMKMMGKNNPMWKGDEASDPAKYQRERRRKLREKKNE